MSESMCPKAFDRGGGHASDRASVEIKKLVPWSLECVRSLELNSFCVPRKSAADAKLRLNMNTTTSTTDGCERHDEYMLRTTVVALHIWCL